jgi:hypothetical protein
MMKVLNMNHKDPLENQKKSKYFSHKCTDDNPFNEPFVQTWALATGRCTSFAAKAYEKISN